MIEVLIPYQDSVIAFALKYKINDRFIVKSKDYSFEIALTYASCFYHAPIFYFMLLPCRILSLFISLFLSCIMLLLQNNYFLSHLSQRAFASPFSTYCSKIKTYNAHKSQIFKNSF